MDLIKPRKLAPGDHVRVLSPSGIITPQLIEDSVARLQSWGLRVSIDDDTFAVNRYLAGADTQRLAALHRAFEDPNVDAIIFSRGGYGAMRIVDGIDWTPMRRDPRLIVGFSDITAIHLAAQSHNFATLHGPVLKSFASQAGSLDSLRATLFGEHDSQPIEVDCVRPGSAVGPIFGGNLSLVAALVGSPLMPSLDGAVLFLEDVGEEDYRLDRLFTTLALSPRFAGIAAIVLGGFDECRGVYISPDDMQAHVRSLAHELGDRWDVPVVAGFPAGHGDRNVPIPLGTQAMVDADAGTVTFTESVTA